jgi:hypothetical protein
VQTPSTPVHLPPDTASDWFWSTKSISSLADFGHVIKVAYGRENQEFAPDPSGAGGSTLKIRYFMQILNYAGILLGV